MLTLQLVPAPAGPAAPHTPSGAALPRLTAPVALRAQRGLTLVLTHAQPVPAGEPLPEGDPFPILF